MVEDTNGKRPDGHMSYFQLGLSKLNLQNIVPVLKRHEDTLRLVDFCKDALERET